ncbi:MAG: ABC transporter substrate-binding protein [Rubrivivax sp.]
MKRRQILATGGLVATLGAARLAHAEPGVNDNEVLLGQSAVLSGPLGVSVKRLNAGAQAVIDEVNAAGGVNGRRIRWLQLDDELAPPKAVANYKRLLETEQVFSLFCCVGSGTTAAAAPVLTATDAVSLGGYAVADSAREKLGKAGFFVRATTRSEAEVLVRQLGTIGVTRTAFVHLDNPGGQEALRLVEAELAAAQLKPVATAAVKADGSNVAQAVATLAAASPQALLIYLGGRLPADVIAGLAAAGQFPSCYGMSIVSGEIAAQVLGDKARGLAIAQLVPFPWNKASPDLQTYRNLMDKAKVDVSYYSLEGWINARVLVEALKRCGRDLRRERFAAVLRGLNLRVAGMEVDFGNHKLAGSRFVELVQVRADGSFAR